MTLSKSGSYRFVTLNFKVITWHFNLACRFASHPKTLGRTCQSARYHRKVSDMSREHALDAWWKHNAIIKGCPCYNASQSTCYDRFCTAGSVTALQLQSWARVTINNEHLCPLGFFFFPGLALAGLVQLTVQVEMNECMTVLCPVLRWLPNQGVSPLHTQFSWDRLPSTINQWMKMNTSHKALHVKKILKVSLQASRGKMKNFEPIA